MRNDDLSVLRRMISYCDDISLLMKRYEASFDAYQTDISFQYSCNMCIIQIGELTGRLTPVFFVSAQ